MSVEERLILRRGLPVERDPYKDSVAEVAKVQETAERLANGESAEGGDQIRVVAGLIQQLATQVVTLAASWSGREMGQATGETRLTGGGPNPSSPLGKPEGDSMTMKNEGKGAPPVR